ALGVMPRHFGRQTSQRAHLATGTFRSDEITECRPVSEVPLSDMSGIAAAEEADRPFSPADEVQRRP
ncbi:hypothetical protein, partial [Staphylococcus aureus]|uniref:hypothetical protein n=1 Tax=Staphylococcus aureus TaxID=1280 RepID=UPI0038B416FE